MTKTKTNNPLLAQIDQSQAVKLLIPAYQEALREFAVNEDFGRQRLLSMIFSKENPQNTGFTEEMLEKFIEQNLDLPSEEVILPQFKEKLVKMIRTFFFFDQETKGSIIGQLSGVTYSGIRELIRLYRLGHHKQSDYLQIFAEKDPKQALKFELTANPKHF